MIRGINLVIEMRKNKYILNEEQENRITKLEELKETKSKLERKNNIIVIGLNINGNKEVKRPGRNGHANETSMEN